jgi:hypothetical protein
MRRYEEKAATSSRERSSTSSASEHLTTPSSVAMQTAWAMLRAPSLARI